MMFSINQLQAGETLRLIQVSDCHLSEAVNTSYRGESADAGLKSLLPVISEWQPHLIILTGDLSEDNSKASYVRIDQYLDMLTAPVCALPGNHDSDRHMSQFFPNGPWNGPLLVNAGKWRLVLLKSSVSGRIDGEVSTGDIRRVSHWMEAEPETPFFLALHHQPVDIGSPWIDRYKLKNPNALLSLVQQYEQVKVVTWGHVHQAFELELAQARLLACPSTAANSLSGTDRFEKDKAGPACRWFELYGDGQFDTGILYANG